MNRRKDQDFSDYSMLDLFRMEVETHSSTLNDGLLRLEKKPNEKETLDELMRAAHSIKGAARIVQLDPVVQLAHALEDCFSAAKGNRISVDSAIIDLWLQGVDALARIPTEAGKSFDSWIEQRAAQLNALTQKIQDVLNQPQSDHPPPPVKSETKDQPPQVKQTVPTETKTELEPPSYEIKEKHRYVRMSAEHLDRLMGLAGESMVEVRRLKPLSQNILKMREIYSHQSNLIEHIVHSLDRDQVDDHVLSHFEDLRNLFVQGRSLLNEHYNEFESYSRRSASISNSLYREVIANRMRPFNDGILAFPRFVRDLSRRLNKKVQLEVRGRYTEVDRDILDKIESPLNHLLRNAVDHGMETPEERVAQGKPETGRILLEARHHGGMLCIKVRDDGRGIDIERLRQRILNKGMAKPDMVEKMSEAELLDFLFLPGFSTSDEVTEISGRGFGLDVVHKVVHEIGGVVHTKSKLGDGTSINLHLPLTLSVIRTLLVEIAGEPYAFPLSRIDRTMMLPREEIDLIENIQYCTLDNENIGILSAAQILELQETITYRDSYPVVLLNDRNRRYGLSVDRFLGERELVVRPIDPRLGKVQDISSASIMTDGSPVLVIDVEDLLKSMDRVLSSGGLQKIGTKHKFVKKRKSRVLVIDDSITVREVERKLLQNKGYDVDVAVDGVDGWNLLRNGEYDLVMTDIDMPRMNGIELVQQVKNHPQYKELPIMVVSYKEREEDRKAGLEAGADYYLTKSSFHDESLVDAVKNLIGEP